MNDTTQKISAEAWEAATEIHGCLGFTREQKAVIIQSAIKKATEETNAANCSLLALAAIVKGHPDTPESLKAIASKELLDHTHGAYLINELRTLRAAHASGQSGGGEWTVTLTQHEVVLRTSGATPPIWFARTGDQIREKLEAIAAAHNATLQPAHASSKSYSDHCPRCGGSRQTLPCPVCEP